MGCGASAPAPNQVADEGPTLKSPEQKPAAAEKPAAEAPPPQAASKPAPAAPSSSESKGAPPASKANGRGPQAPIAHSKALPDRIRTEELIKLCQSSHFDRTQARAPRTAGRARARRVKGGPADGVARAAGVGRGRRARAQEAGAAASLPAARGGNISPQARR